MTTGLAVRAGERFDPDQPRWPPGTPGGRGGEWLGEGLPDLAGRDRLKLAGRISLDAGEVFAGSAAVDAGDGTVVPVAAVRTPAGMRLRIGTGLLDEDRGRWSAADRGHTANLPPAGVAELQETLDDLEGVATDGVRRLGVLADRADRLAERQRELIRAQHPGLSRTRGQQLDRVDAQILELEARLARIDRRVAERVDRLPAALQQQYQRADPAEQLRIITDWHDQHPVWRTVGVGGFHAEDMRARARLAAELDTARARRVEVAGDPVPLPPELAAELDRVTVELQQAELARAELADSTLAEGAIPGGWVDLAYQVSLDEEGRPGYALAARRHDAPADWTPGDDDTASDLTAAQLRQLAAAIAELVGEPATEAWDPAKHPRGPDGKFIRKGTVARLFGLEELQPALPFGGLVNTGRARSARRSFQTGERVRDKRTGRAARVTRVPDTGANTDLVNIQYDDDGQNRLVARANIERIGATPSPEPGQPLSLDRLGSEIDELVRRVDLDEPERSQLRRQLRRAVLAAGRPAPPSDESPARRRASAPARPSTRAVSPVEVVADLRFVGSRDEAAARVSGLTVNQLQDVAWSANLTVPASLGKQELRDVIVEWVGRRLDFEERMRRPPAPAAPARPPRPRAGVTLPDGLVDGLRAGTSREQVRDLLSDLGVAQLRAVADEMGIAAGRMAKPQLVEHLVHWIIGVRLNSRAIFPGTTEAWNPVLHPRGPDGRFVDRGVIGALLGGAADVGRSVVGSARRAARVAAVRLRAAADTDEARAALAGLSLVALRALADELPVPGLSFAARSELVEELVRSVFARREAIEAAEAAGDQLKRYWTKDPEGLAKWATRPHPWTALYRQLVRHMPPARAKRVASAWFREVFGIWPGERFGDNPAGPG